MDTLNERHKNRDFKQKRKIEDKRKKDGEI